jgi:hypothetical protein
MADDDVVNPEMVIVTLVPDEPALARHCPNCHRQFKARDQVFVSLREEVMIHASCIVGLALVASVRNFIPATPETTYDHLREYLLDTTRRSAELADEPVQADD